MVIHRQQGVFFVRQQDIAHVERLLSSSLLAKIQPLPLKNFDAEPMAGVYFNSQQQLYRAREHLQNNEVHCLEADIRPAERYLMERFLTGPVQIHIADSTKVKSTTGSTTNASTTTDSITTASPLTLNNPRLSPAEYHPNFQVMSLDIETNYQTNQLYSIAFITNQINRVLMLQSAQESPPPTKNDEKCVIEYCSNEAAILKRFLSWVEIINPDVFIGWNVINFDFRFLQKKADDFQIPLTIGRQKSLALWRQQKNSPGRHFLVIPGRVVLDGIDTLKSATYSFPSFSLESVGQALLGRGKLIHDDARQDPLYSAKEIQRQFNEDKTALAAYNLEDCQLVWDIFAHTELINFAIERARLTGLEMDRMGGSVAAFDNLYLPRLHRKGYVAPNIGDYDGKLTAPGGYVMESVPGMHRNVLVLDYKSLYPSIIRTFKVDPYGRIAAEQHQSEDTVPGYDGATFSKHDHILPDIIKQLWQARDQAKAEKNKALSQAIKIIMNSFYGVLGTPGCRIHDARLTSSITKRSHAVILKTVEIIEQEGYVVIYGDTDSVFVALNTNHDKSYTNAQAGEVGHRLVSLINQYWATTLKNTYDIPSYLEMEYETHFLKFFMPTIRGSEKGSKKRYAGMVQNEKGERQLIFKGLETVRTDWTLLARQFQKMLYDKVFNDKPYENEIRQLVQALKNGEHDNDLIYRKRLRQPLMDYKKNIPPHAQAAIKAERYFAENKFPSRYQHASWIEYVITLNGPEVLTCQTAPLDYPHYIEKQLTPIADAILNSLGRSMTKIIQDQYELF